MTMTLEKTRSEFEGIEEVESCKSERPQGYYVSWGKMNWSTIDANGNESSSQQYSYSWDAANRLVGVSIIGPVPTTQANNIQMTYDGKGRRVSITELHGSTVLTAKTFVWCAQSLCEEKNSTGSSVSALFYYRGEQINGTNYYFTKDYLGSVREMVDSSGNVQARYDYDPFGRQNQISGTVSSDFGFTGYYQEVAASMYLTLYRAYDAGMGRWLSRDPVNTPFRDERNLYEYVQNNVISHVDPLGLKDCKPPCTQAPPLPSTSSKCDDYGNETYLGASEKCFCKCMGDGQWAQNVRGCLSCKFGNGGGNWFNEVERHAECYIANPPPIVIGAKLEDCWAHCFLYGQGAQ